MLESLFNQTWSDGLESYLTLEPSNEPLEINSKIAALRRDVERYRKKIAICQGNASLEAAIPGYESKIAEKEVKIRELESSVAAGDEGGKPPRGGGIFGDGADYSKEKDDLKRYFHVNHLSKAFVRNEDLGHAAIAVRLLNFMGKKLDNYEVHIPADYRLQLLKRVGKLCEDANIFQRVQEGNIKLFKPRETIEGGFIFRVTETPPELQFKEGFTRTNDDFCDMYAHVYDYDYRKKDGYISALKSTGPIKDIWFKPRRKGGFGWTPEKLKRDPLYVYAINPRAFLGIDVETSAETFSKLIPGFDDKGSRKYHFAFEQKEVAVPGFVDSRDIRNVFKLQYDGKNVTLTNMQKNESYIMSSWELPGT